MPLPAHSSNLTVAYGRRLDKRNDTPRNRTGPPTLPCPLWVKNAEVTASSDVMSALPLKADNLPRPSEVCLGPKADMKDAALREG